MNKNFNNSIESYEISDDDLSLINSFTVKPLNKDEVFAFNVILCDNEIDRDTECFDYNSLKKLSELFVGKTGIFDHSMKSADQTARIYDTQIVNDESRLTSYGDKYVYLKAKAYMPITEKNLDLITEINAGIKKEISINCSVEKKVCSICRKSVRFSSCQHDKGKEYNGKKCHHILVNPIDAYEWSFVAVPAQKNAGITKSFKERTDKTLNMMNIISVFKSVDTQITITKSEAEEILKELENLQLKASEGEEYRNILKSEILRLSCSAMPKISSKSIENICSTLPLNELKTLKSDFEEVAENFKSKPQLSSQSNPSLKQNNDFII
ncbi:MAG: hypothetical protein IIX39_01010 [Clostridia bacterium]|nr:hypothetical protein [Clostridia bacterium]